MANRREERQTRGGNQWTGAYGRSQYDRTGAVSRGWNEPRYGYRPSPGYGHGEWPCGRSYAGCGPRGYRRSDERILEEVCDRLTDDEWVDATDVEVAVREGVVSLAGTVRSRDEKRHTEALVERVAGVLDVENLLRIRREA